MLLFVHLFASFAYSLCVISCNYSLFLNDFMVAVVVVV